MALGSGQGESHYDEDHSFLLFCTIVNGRWYYFRWPGKTGRAFSGSLGYLPGNRFRCFTTNGQPFEPTRGGYTPFAVYAVAKHGGDFQAAAKAPLRQRPRLTCDPWLGPRS